MSLLIGKSLADMANCLRATGPTLQPRYNHAGGSSLNFQGPPEQTVSLVQDSLNWLSVIRNLKPTDVIVLLTPVVIPVSRDPGDTTDPFECFGTALRNYHRKIRHVPYTTRNGITSTHVGMIKRATIVVFVITETLRREDAPQIHAALVTRKALRDERPLLIVLTSTGQDLEQFSEDFPTIIKSKDYTRPTLETTASFIFGKDGDTALPTRRALAAKSQPRLWPVEQWIESRDIDSVYELWTQSMDVRFAMHVSTLTALLRRPGYARHYVVRDSDGSLLGFCATFLSYVDQAGEKLIASLAILLVDIEHQYQGIGLSLHNYAIENLKRTRGVCRLQLGSTFPRILYGPPFYMEFDQQWFSRRGWRSDTQNPGQGQAAYDMLLDFSDWTQPPPDRSVFFRNGTQADMKKVLEIVEAEIAREHQMGWFDQYSKLVGDVNVKDIVVGVEGNIVTGVALTYTPSCVSPISLDLPWAGQNGDDVGGVTCICIPRMNPYHYQSLPRPLLIGTLTYNHSFPAAKRDAMMVQLLNACIMKLQEQGMKKMFIDAVIKNVDGFKQLGMDTKIFQQMFY
jgi:predicted N-acetyltransferase YhbS